MNDDTHFVFLPVVDTFLSWLKFKIWHIINDKPAKFKLRIKWMWLNVITVLFTVVLFAGEKPLRRGDTFGENPTDIDI